MVHYEMASVFASFILKRTTINKKKERKKKRLVLHQQKELPIDSEKPLSGSNFTERGKMTTIRSCAFCFFVC